MIAVVVVVVGLVMMLGERLRPGRVLARVRHWWARALAASAVQAALVLWAGIAWEPWMQAHRPWSGEGLGTTGGALVGYLAITLIYHVREQMRKPDNHHGWAFHTSNFYAKCVLLGYALFNCWPYVFVWFGAGVAESMILVIATINIHHFIVDAYIWRLRVPANRTALADRAKQPQPT